MTKALAALAALAPGAARAGRRAAPRFLMFHFENQTF